MSEYQIAIKIAGQLESSFNNALRGAQKGLSGFGVAGKIGGAALKGATMAMVAAGTAIAGVGAYSIKTGKEFESAMSSAAATAGATEEQYKTMEEAAMKMGRTTSKTAAESANALEYMALAGWDVGTSVKALPSVLKLSEATGLDLARTSDLVTDSMAAMGISVEKLPNYLDVAAKAQNSSNQSAEQMMEAYLNVGGTMKDLGVPIEESAAALGVMANRGRKGGEAGQALSAIMANLTTGTGQAGKMMERLGISAFDSNGNFIGLKKTLETVNNATKNLSDEERNAALAALGGKQHVKDLNKLLGGLNDTTENGEQEWAALQKSLENCNGALDDMRDMKMDNLEGDLATLNSAAQDFGIHVYKNMNAPLRQLAQYGTNAIYQLSDALESGGFEGLSKTIGTVFADAVTQAAAAAPQVVGMVSTLLDGFFSGLQENSGKIGQSVAMLLLSLGRSYIQALTGILATGMSLFTGLANGLAAQLPGAMANITQTIVNFAQSFNTKLPQLLAAMTNLISSLVQTITANAPALIAAGISMIANLAIGLFQSLPMIVQSAVQLINGLVSAIMANVPLLLQAAAQMVMALVQGILQSLPAIVVGAVQLIAQLRAGLFQNLPNLITAAYQIIAALASGLIQAIPMIVSTVPQIAQSITQTLMSTNWLEVGVKIIQAIVMGIFNTVNQIGGAIGNAVMSIFTGKSDWAMPASQGGQQVTMGMANGITSNSGLVTNAASTLNTTAFGALDPSPATTAGARNAGAYTSSLTGTLSSYQIDSSVTGNALSNGGTIGAATAAGAKNAGAYTQAISSGITSNPVDASTVINASQTASTLTATGTESAAAFTGAINSGISGSAIDTSALQADSGALSSNMQAAGQSSGQALIDALNQTISSATIDVSSIQTNEVGMIAKMKQVGQESASAISEGITAGMSTVSAAISAGFVGAQAAVTSGMNGIRTAITSAITSLTTTVTTGMTMITTIIQTSGTTISSTMTAATTAITSFNATAASITGTAAIMSASMMQIAAAATPMAAALSVLVGPMAMTAGAMAAFAASVTIALAVMSALNAALSTAASMTAVINAAFVAMGAAATAGMTQVASATTSGMAQMVAALTSGGARGVSVMRRTANQIVNAIRSGMNRLVSAARSAMNSFVSAISSGGSRAASAARSAASSIAGAFSGISLYSTGANIMSGLVSGMQSQLGALRSIASQAGSIAASMPGKAAKVNSPSKITMKTGRSIDEGLIKGIQKDTGGVMKAAYRVITPVIEMSQAASTEALNVKPRWDSSAISDTVSNLSGSSGGSRSANAQEPQIVYSPNNSYNFYGEAPSKEEISEAATMDYKQFTKFMKQYNKHNRMVSFA